MHPKLGGNSETAALIINFTAISMQINFSQIISFKVASYSAYYLTNGDYITYLLEKLTRENKSDRGGKAVELFSVLIQIVQAVL